MFIERPAVIFKVKNAISRKLNPRYLIMESLIYYLVTFQLTFPAYKLSISSVKFFNFKGAFANGLTSASSTSLLDTIRGRVPTMSLSAMLLDTPSFWAPQITAASESLHYFHEDCTIGSTVTSKHNCSIISGWFSRPQSIKKLLSHGENRLIFLFFQKYYKGSINNFQTERDFSQGRWKHPPALFSPLLKSAKSIFCKATHTHNPSPLLKDMVIACHPRFLPCRGRTAVKAFQSLQGSPTKCQNIYHLHTSHWSQKNSWNMRRLKVHLKMNSFRQAERKDK